MSLDLLTSCKRSLLIAALGILAAGHAAAHDPVGTKVTWDREIAPIIGTRCWRCHGTNAEIPLITYEQARPWAKAIKEEVLTRRMPKWPAVRGYGDFSNDPSLSPFEIALIAAWADGGAPETLPRTAPPGVSFIVPPEFKPPNLPREISVGCGAPTLPPGQLVGIRPHLPAGGSLRLVVESRQTGAEPLLWIKDFDPRFAEHYWLRTPITVGRATHRVFTAATVTCTLQLFYSATP